MFDGMEIRVRVTPNAKLPSVTKLGDSDYRVKVDARPVEGKANARLVEILADHFGAPKSHVVILKGSSGRNKVVEVRQD